MSAVRIIALLFAGLFAYAYGTPTPVVYDTIVVGLGASGTGAATTLAKAGKKVLALEAQNRIGGRVYTEKFGGGIIELGAEWIHGTENSSTYELAVQNNITVLGQDSNLYVYRSDGTNEKENIIKELTVYTLEVVEQLPEEPQSMGQFITRRILERIREKYPSIQNDTDFIENLLHHLDVFIDTYDSSSNWNDTTTKSSYQNLVGNQDMSWHTYGYKTLFEILLNKYNNGPGYPTLEIKLNTEVTKIQYPQDPKDNVVVTTKDGATYTAKNVIVTMSVGVLKERYQTLFSPPLPEVKIRSIKAIVIGICNKIVFRFAEQWWPENFFGVWVWRNEDKEKLSEDDKWLYGVNSPSVPMAQPNSVVTLWTCGETAKKIETLSEEVVTTKVMGLIRQFMGKGKTIPDPVESLKTSWYSNPFTRGSYTFDDVTMPQHPTVRSDLAQPLLDSSGAPRVLFAGEASNPIRFSTAYKSVGSAAACKYFDDVTMPQHPTVRSDLAQPLLYSSGAPRVLFAGEASNPIHFSTVASSGFLNSSLCNSVTTMTQHLTVRSDLAQPLLDSSGAPRVMFAGEASNPIRFSTVHGALDSGRREANRLLAASS